MQLPPATPPLSHHEFVTAVHEGSITVNFEPEGAARFLSALLLLPLVVVPVLSVGVALALTGWVWTGLLITALGIIVPKLIKRGAPRFLVQLALSDENVYQKLLRADIIQIIKRERA